MKKILIRIGVIVVLLLAMNWVYTKWFFEKDLLEHSDIIELPRQVVADSCRIVYLGESSNNTYGYAESDHRKISQMVAEYYPEVKMGDMTKAASHAQTYYYMLKQIPEDASVETVVVTMNLRSFGAGWIYSKLETALRKQLVLLEDYPPLANRFLLAFKAYPIRSEEEWGKIVKKHWKEDLLVFPYDCEWKNTHQWDSAMSWRGCRNYEGVYDPKLTELACHYVKSYAFSIADDNPRLKDFDDIVALCRQRGWNLVFNLMAENVDKANELVGRDLMCLMKQNHDYLLDRYGHLEGVTVVDNLNLVRDVNFIDQDWTTEHYYAEGRHVIAEQVAEALKTYYPDRYRKVELKYDAGHYFTGEEERTLNTAAPYSKTVSLTANDLSADWERVNVAFMMRQADTLHKSMLVVQLFDGLGGAQSECYPVKPQIQKIGQWDFATFDLPVDSVMRTAQQIKIFVYNPSENTVQVKRLDVSFRPAYLKPGVKACPIQTANR